MNAPGRRRCPGFFANARWDRFVIGVAVALCACAPKNDGDDGPDAATHDDAAAVDMLHNGCDLGVWRAPGWTPDQAPPVIIVENPGDLERFRGYTEVDAFLEVRNGFQGNVDPLACARRIGGFNTWGNYTEWEDLDGLRNLEQVDTIFKIADQDEFRDVEMLASLRHVGHLSLSSMTKLETLEGLRNLETAGLIRIGGTLDALVELDGFGRLIEVDSLLIGAVHANDLSNFESLETLRELDLSRTRGIIDLRGLPAGVELEVLDVNECPDLQSLQGLPAGSVTTLRELTVTSNPALTSLAGLEELSFVGGRDAPGIRIEYNGALDSLAALSNLEGIAGFNGLILRGNALTTLHGLESLVRIDGPLVIEVFAQLVDVDALRLGMGGSLAYAASGVFRSNPKTSQCDLEALRDQLVAGGGEGPFYVVENGPCQ